MSKTKVLQSKERTENLVHFEEFNEYEISDEEADEYFENSNSHTIGDVFDPQNSIWSAAVWRRRKLNDYAFMERMGKPPTSLSAKKMLAGDSNAKKLVELWSSANCRASDVENFLKNNPVDSAQYLIAILDYFEMNGISKGVKAVRTGIAIGGAKAKSEKSKKGIAMNNVKIHWIEWQLNPSRFKFKTHFASAMLTRYPILKSQKQITENCTAWEKDAIFAK